MRYKHLRGMHNQQLHGNRGTASVTDETTSAHEKRFLIGGITKDDVVGALMSASRPDTVIDEIKITKFWAKLSAPMMVFRFSVNPKSAGAQKGWEGTFSLSVDDNRVVTLSNSGYKSALWDKMYKNLGNSAINLFRGKGYKYLSIPVPKEDGVFYDYKKISLA